jgi:pimeloyl-ACP methyl ester carboxylesterase
MNIILVPGFWLDGSSWATVAAPLVAAGHTVRALTLPGMESVDADRSDITLRDHVDAVVAAIDAFGASNAFGASDAVGESDEVAEPVVLVGHSGGGALIHAAADARPTRVARAIYVDSGPLAAGASINDELPVVDGEIPLPDWAVFDDQDLVDLTDELRAEFRAIAIPEPARVASDAQVLTDERRYSVPTTVIACEFTTELLTAWIDGGHPFVAELASMTDRELVDLPTGHWPQFTRPLDLAEAILKAVARD